MVQFMVKPGQATVRCDQVNECLASCIPYLTSGAGNPTAQCCGGVGRLQKIAETTADKQEACNCIKQAVAGFPLLRKMQPQPSLPKAMLKFISQSPTTPIAKRYTEMGSHWELKEIKL
ncbi:non-specific lipid-transfer protein A-like [Herrania umbratica]|uniref:Non-specific lipid-transfer protein A-like n=1 Tax=Herrania umbratica TaxID=108875 RepID=A0A6J0ZYC3_9ROSI|nr:non-specific lipid-transfer protein A-like [Herrania umbratica]